LKPIVIRSKKLPISLTIYTKTLTALLVLSALCFGVLVYSVGTGEVPIPAMDVVKVLFGQGDPGNELIIYSLRMPRVLTALMVGASMAVSGALLQGMLRNPLASPDIIGITGGASVAAVACLSLFSQTGKAWLPVAAFGGAVCTAFLVYVLAWKRGVSPLRLVLIGMGLHAAANGLTTLLLILSPIYTASQAMVWLTGSVYNSSWTTVGTLSVWTGILIPAAFLLARHLNAQQLGDELAVGIGSRVQLHRFLLILISVALASAAVAAAGPIGFVGLMAPHIARMWAGPSAGSWLPVSALTGSFLVLTADLIARTAFSPLDLPAGLFTAALGAPFLLFLLLRSGSHRH
jgi:iron complex transport system permease protein